MRFRLSVVMQPLLIAILALTVFSSELFANPNFLNRQSFPLKLALTDIGQFHKNDLKTFEIWTQWSNSSNETIVVKVLFSFIDIDSADSQLGEDGTDDLLMTVTEVVTIPGQVNNWGRYFYLTAIGQKLNKGFDHTEEGAGLELYLDAQVTSVQYLQSK